MFATSSSMTQQTTNELDRIKDEESVLNMALALETQIDVLKDLFESAGGLNWNWKSGPDAAPRWSFNMSVQQNPCADSSGNTSVFKAWQGVSCDNSPDVCYMDNNL